MKPTRLFSLLVLWLAALQPSMYAASRIKDIAAFEGVRDNQLVGYGLLVGLNGTGDRSQTFFSTQTLANMLERSGITILPEQVRVKNIAAVMVTATLPPFVRPGSRIDVTVSSVGDAQSIQGGVLVMTPLKGADNQVYVTAQGSVVLGGFSSSGTGNRVQMNHPTGGLILSGGLVEKDVPVDLSKKSQFHLLLHNNDFTTASRAVRAINETLGAEVAAAIDGRTINLALPSSYNNHVVDFMAMVENAKLEVDLPAKVIINEKTGTVVMGKEVKIGEVSIIHGSLSLQVGTLFKVSQPEPFSQGHTQVTPETTVAVQEDKGRTVTLREGASVEEVVRALNAIGAGPRDIIAILQAIKAEGALQAQLEIL
jgi:flagellar P-ring protein precursor FlgI